MADDEKDKVLLAAGDRELLKAAVTGEGAIQLTPELLEELRKGFKEREADIAARYPKLVAECPYETRLAIVAWVFEQIVAHAREGGSFRYLIYDRLGFDLDAYVPLYLAGGMTISNEFDLSKSELK